MRETVKSRVEDLEQKVLELECVISDMSRLLTIICRSQDEMHDEIRLVEKFIKGSKSMPVLPGLRKSGDDKPN